MSAMLQDGVQVGGVERALAGLVDHRLAGLGIKLGNDVVAGFAAHQNAAHRAGVADRGRAAAANLLGRRQIAEVGPMALAGMDHRKAGGAPGREQLPVRLDGAAQLRNVVAEHFAEAAGLQKIALHVDDEQRAVLGRERERIGFGREVYRFIHAPRRVKGRRQSEFATASPKVSGPLRSAGHSGARKEHACRPAGAIVGQGRASADCWLLSRLDIASENRA